MRSPRQVMQSWAFRIRFRSSHWRYALRYSFRRAVDRRQRALRLLGWLICSSIVAFSLLALADQHVQAPLKTCRFGFGWIGCVLANHENLAGACFTLVAALVAWAALQEQLREGQSERRAARAALLVELKEHAETFSSAWSVLEGLEDNADHEKLSRGKEAVQYACREVSSVDAISSYRQMALLLSWEERMHFETLLRQLEQLQRIDWDSEAWQHAVRWHFQEMSFLFEGLVPETSEHFENFSRRTPRAMSTGDYVKRIAGIEGY